MGAVSLAQDDIPFDVYGDWSLEGSYVPTRPLVEWAAKHGTMRSNPLCPKDNPLLAADRLHEKIIAGERLDVLRYWPEDGRKKAQLKDHLRKQAIAMLPKNMRVDKDVPWNEILRRVKRNRLRWDQNSQAYRRAAEQKR